MKKVREQNKQKKKLNEIQAAKDENQKINKKQMVEMERMLDDRAV